MILPSPNVIEVSTSLTLDSLFWNGFECSTTTGPSKSRNGATVLGFWSRLLSGTRDGKSCLVFDCLKDRGSSNGIV